jgi:hypothetical protein
MASSTDESRLASLLSLRLRVVTKMTKHPRLRHVTKVISSAMHPRPREHVTVAEEFRCIMSQNQAVS